jgi:hypothetical protein
MSKDYNRNESVEGVAQLVVLLDARIHLPKLADCACLDSVQGLMHGLVLYGELVPEVDQELLLEFPVVEPPLHVLDELPDALGLEFSHPSHL